MTYKIRFQNIEIPELDAFLREYSELCKKHGMALEVGEYDYGGGSYVTIGKPDDLHLNLDYADRKVACIRDAFERADRLRAKRS